MQVVLCNKALPGAKLVTCGMLAGFASMQLCTSCSMMQVVLRGKALPGGKLMVRGMLADSVPM